MYLGKSLATHNAPLSAPHMTEYLETVSASAECVIRIALTNIKSLPDSRCTGNSCHSCKDCLIQKLITQHRIDHFGMSEINVNWQFIRDESLKPHLRTKHWFAARKLSSSYFNPTRPGSFRHTMNGCGLTETISTQHGVGPQTHVHGSKPIDGLFVSAGLRGFRCGHAGQLADHILLYIDIPTSTAFGQHLLELYTEQACWLKLGDKRTVDKYKASLQKFFDKNSVPTKLEELWEHATKNYQPDSCNPTPSEAYMEKYDALDAHITSGVIQAKRQCRRLHMGATPWSPEYKIIEDKLHFYNTLLCRGHQIQPSTLQRIAHRQNNLAALFWTISKVTRLQKQTL
jgi:hypothetical protein